MEAHGTPGDGGNARRTTDRASECADLFRLLGDGRRVRTLLTLREESPTTLSELAAGVAAREREVTREELATADVRRVSIALYHAHLPKLRDAGVIEFDPDDGFVSLGADAADAFELLDAVDVA